MARTAEVRTPDPASPVAVARVLHIATVDSTLRFMLLGQLRRMAELGYEVAAMSAEGPFREDIEADGRVRFVPWPGATRRVSPLGDLRAFVHLFRYLRRERFEVVHTHNPKPGILGRVAARLARVPAVVNTVHGFYATESDSALKRWIVLAAEWVAARFSHFELYQSAEDHRRARRLRLARSGRSAHLGNGADLAWFDPGRVSIEAVERLRREWRIPAGAIVVGMVGRLVEEKGWIDLFEAARAVRARHPNVVFVAIGPHDPDKPDAIDATVIDAARDDVRFCGLVLDMPAALHVLDVFVLASYREGMPRSAVEAAAMGKPLVCSDIRGCREVVREGENGFLVPPRRPDRLAEAISRLVEDAGLRDRMGRAARERAAHEFDERRVVEQTVAVYRRLLETRSNR